MSSSFSGRETCTVDAKGRVNVPARMRRGLSPEAADTLTLVRGPNGCARIYPRDEWQKYVDLLDTYSPGDEENMTFLRSLYASAHETTIDGQGRISTTPELLDEAGITNQAVFLGIGRTMELWDPKRLEARLSPGATAYDAGFTRMTKTIQEKRNGPR
jgi:MraZ protein